jgi:hypothetical protein
MLSNRAFKPRIEKSHRADEWKRCEPFLKWLRGRPCFLSIHAPKEHKCEGKVRACHFDPWGDKGMGTKVSDSAAMPMCDRAHMLQTDIMGWPSFQRHFGFDGRDVVTAYWLEWLDGTPMGSAWKKKQEGEGA